MLAWFERDDCPVASADRQYLRALFDKADWHTLLVRRGADRLAKVCGVTETSARSALKRLVRAHAIVRTEKGGARPGDADQYRLLIP